MRPSLFSLFKRGRYFRLPPPADDEATEIIRARKEAERFTAAAIGFCMRHHRAFAQHFLDRVCNITLPPRTKISVDVEPESWADLLIRVGDVACVVEFKLTADLQPHQDPSSSAFWDAGSGYGARLQSAFPSKNKRFVVLGHSGWLTLPERARWEFVQSSWADLATGFEARFGKVQLLCDLRDCLAEFEIWDFTKMKIQEMHISPHHVAFGSLAWQMMLQAYLNPNLRLARGSAAYRLDAEAAEARNWHFGIEVQTLASRALRALLRPRSAGAMMWFGYESSRRDTVYRSVWYYCENERIAASISEKLRPLRQSGYRLLRPDDERGDRCYLGIRSPAQYLSYDFDWFCGWLDASMNLANRFAPIERDESENPRSRSRHRRPRH
jgi:hypothetical protein